LQVVSEALKSSAGVGARPRRAATTELVTAHFTVAVFRPQCPVVGGDPLILKEQVVAAILSTVDSLDAPVPLL